MFNEIGLVPLGRLKGALSELSNLQSLGGRTLGAVEETDWLVAVV